MQEAKLDFFLNLFDVFLLAQIYSFLSVTRAYGIETHLFGEIVLYTGGL